MITDSSRGGGGGVGQVQLIRTARAQKCAQHTTDPGTVVQKSLGLSLFRNEVTERWM